MSNYVLQKEEFSAFFSQVSENYDFIAPIKGKETSFEKVTNDDMLNLIEWDELPLFPIKHFFQPKDEPIFKYDKTTAKDVNSKPRKTVLFGLRLCDLNAIHHRDMALMNEDFTDPFYKERRENSILIGLHCKKGDEYCFCGDMDLHDFFDLMLYEHDECFIIETKTDKGLKFAKKITALDRTDKAIHANDRITENNTRIDKEKMNKIADFFTSEKWEEGSKLCLSCTACNMLCPSCYCFEFTDEPELVLLHKGQRMRNISSCQLKCFTRVAGDFVFRKEKNDRFKHRIYHQLQYFKEKHGVTLCVGCGRCIRGCPKRIDWVDILNKM
ncbi:MAG: 4Fe-4S dicluster domain-containing protein [Nanoarchaeota archaeon]|nr:4Fe-4S dicluster domain-containing protein [Nanoarchaeota archaeon]